MGFGTLFIGYFLLLNITPYYCATDAIAGLIMLLAFIQLARINRPFARAKWSAVAFSVFGVGELVLFLLGMLINDIKAFYDLIFPYTASARSLILAVLTIFMLEGIRQVSLEVDLEKIPMRSKYLTYFAAITYLIWLIVELDIGSVFGDAAVAVFYLCAILLVLLLHILNLATVYGCYMRICMPGEENGKPQKPSRFKFVNEYREKKAEREREEEEYRREQLKKKAEKRRKKK